MKEIVVKNPGHILDCALACSEHLQTQAWFRGQSRFDWALRPKVYRNTYTRDNEVGLLRKFQNLAPSRRAGCPKPNEYADWLFLAQHFGLQTRLLDWSESVLTAAYFAVSEREHDGHDGVIWALNPSGLNEVETQHFGVFSPEHPIAKRLIALPFWDPNANVEYDKKTLALEPHQVDSRMMVQHAAFTIHGSDSALDLNPNAHKCLAKIRIPANLKLHIQGALNFAGVRESTVFPDLGHLANEVNQSRNERVVFPRDS